MSDHLYISFTLKEQFYRAGAAKRPITNLAKWNFKKLDDTMLIDALTWASCVGPTAEELENGDLDTWINNALRNACDASTSRAKPFFRRTRVYWWSDDIAELRRIAIVARRIYIRSRGRGDPRLTVFDRHREYRRARGTLGTAIARAKAACWQDHLYQIDVDPWGIPYKLVMKRLRVVGASLTESLHDNALDALLDSLFPPGQELQPLDWPVSDFQWQDEWRVTVAEITDAIKAKKCINTAPGPDCVKPVVFRFLPEITREKLASVFTAYLRRGIFPASWKRVGLVLILKGTTTADQLQKARPICLLDEIGKLFERVIASRMLAFMGEDAVAGLAPNQFGFHKQKSTMDALLQLKTLAKDAIRDHKYALATSLDVVNTFNSLPWPIIRRTLRWRKGFPFYICRIIDFYLTDRWIEYFNAEGRLVRRRVTAGVPQGSVLGPLLWNVSFDAVLRTRLVQGCDILCYTDDTLLFVVADSVESVCTLAERQLRRLIPQFTALGLGIATEKTEAVMFSRRGLVGNPTIRFCGAEIRVTNKIKYLGVFVDSRLSFAPHFTYAESKASGIARALGRLMPNLRGPSQAKRKLYVNTVMPVLLFGSPVWAEELATSTTKQRPMRKSQKIIACRMVAAYKTVSFLAATLLAGLPPVWFLALSRARSYHSMVELRESGCWCGRAARAVKKREEECLRRDWLVHISIPDLPGKRTRFAIIPHFELWLDRSFGDVSFHITQLLTGHGCFSSFLHRIGRLETNGCFHCLNDVDSADHTLMLCSSWDNDRRDLTDVIGRDLALSSIMEAISSSKEAWMAFARFATTVMRKKEAAERDREERNIRALPPPLPAANRDGVG